MAQLLLQQPHYKVHLDKGLRKPRSANQPALHFFLLSHTPCHHHQPHLDRDSMSASQLEQIWQCCMARSSPVNVVVHIHSSNCFCNHQNLAGHCCPTATQECRTSRGLGLAGYDYRGGCFNMHLLWTIFIVIPLQHRSAGHPEHLSTFCWAGYDDGSECFDMHLL